MPKNINTDITLNDDLKFLIACCQSNPSEADTAFIHSFIQHSTFLELNSDTPVAKAQEGYNIAPSGNALGVKHLLTLSSQHGILPLVYKTIKNLSENTSLRSLSLSKCSSIQHSKSNIQHFLSELKPIYISIVQKNMLMTSELLKIMHLLKENSIEALAFKGPTLSQMAYGDITLRQYGDLDVFVHKDDLCTVADLLSGNLYEARMHLDYFKNDAFLNVNSDVQFYHQSKGILIEMHWTVFRNSFAHEMKQIDLWQSPTKVRIQNFELQTFKKETLLLYLCMHGSKHIWERVEWIVDIDRLVRSVEILKWDEIYEQAHLANGTTMLELGLYLSISFFHTPLPNKIENRIKENSKLIQLASSVLESINQKSDDPDSEVRKNYRHLRFHLLLRDSVIEKVSFLARTLMPINTSDVEIVNLPKGLYFLYYLMRPFRLMKKYALKIIQKES